MKTEKIASLFGIAANLVKFMGQDRVKRLADVAKGSLEGLRMRESWKKRELVPLYKMRDDARSCGNYKSVKLLKHKMKVIEQIFEERLWKMARSRWGLSQEKRGKGNFLE